jgi:hypothetical protein
LDTPKAEVEVDRFVIWDYPMGPTMVTA